jgi:endonuclease YncB( thermonuclease family)
MTLQHRLTAAILLAALALGARANSFEGVVTHVTDGDSLWVQPASGGPPRNIRLQGIDAPEICQAYGAASRNALASHVLHRPVAVHGRALDVYQRVLGRVSMDGEDVGAWLVGRGLAWSSRFGHHAAYGALEERARSARLGLWSDATAMRPREFRKRHGSCK